MSKLRFQDRSVHWDTLPKMGLRPSSWCWLIAHAPENLLVAALVRKFSNNPAHHEQAAEAQAKA